MNKKYFKLFANCKLVEGYKRSVIVDTQRNEIFHVSNSLIPILTSLNDSPIADVKITYESDDIQEYLDFLIANELGFYTDTPNLFTDIDTKWDSPDQITNAIIDYNKSSNYDFKHVFNTLDTVHCTTIQIRFFDSISWTFLLDILDLIKGKRISSVELLLKYNPEISFEDYRYLVQNYLRIKGMVIHGSPKDVVTRLATARNKEKFVYTDQAITDQTHCGIISTSLFAPTLLHHNESLYFNSCLHRKIGVDVNGNIKNCPTLEDSYGNIKEVSSLKEIVELASFQELWGITKNQIDECKVCEYRTVCSDCRAHMSKDEIKTAKPKKCNYNPYEAKWF
ncbi:grasp-with-spasm system SPASM domain peptide maturase [Aquimarina sp. SS2-1]|uniref:grasp-with-spasm system SPASM domain peptide maturase n=1 Tax=Aquimarina besae TaxID=3342247 RepID=UPI00366AE58F